MVDKSLWLKKLSFRSMSGRLRGLPPAQAVIVLCAPRTGSTLLSSYLDGLHGLKSYGEILNPETYPFFGDSVKFPFKGQLALFKIQSTLAETRGSIKLIFGHLERIGLTPRDVQSRFPSAHYIVLYRRSLIDAYISLLKAQKTQTWASKSKASASQRFSVHLDEEDFKAFCQRAKRLYMNCNFELLLQRAIVLEYQALSAHPQLIFEKTICPFLDIPYRPVQSSLKKQIEVPLAQTIENFDEVQPLFNASEAVLNFDLEAGGFY